MEKKIYIFNCEGTFDTSQVFELFAIIKRITYFESNKYCLLFYDESGNMRSRTGSVKNMEKNIPRYLSSCSKFEFYRIEINDKPQDADFYDTEKRHYEFDIWQWEPHIMNIYIVLPHSLNETEIIDAWNQISAHCNTNYMIHYDFDAKKDPELCMNGTPVIRGLANMEEYFSENEYKIVYKLNDLRMHPSLELGDVFPICITTKNFSVAEQSYKSKINIGPGTYLFSK